MKALSKDNIFQILKQNKEQLKNHHVKRIGLFGSFLRGDNSSKSDIDVIVEFDEGRKNYDNFIEVSYLLEKIFERKIDLLTIEALSPHMKSKILKEAHFESI
ncbi:MAG: nucleotidyltransferase [Promethearchaeota archaeon]|nr:MAG: nucleotidyltransferase [Candidatus Lokiarchaeota archaeon]